MSGTRIDVAQGNPKIQSNSDPSSLHPTRYETTQNPTALEKRVLRELSLVKIDIVLMGARP